jgi:hypothetical protein
MLVRILIVAAVLLAALVVHQFGRIADLQAELRAAQSRAVP